MVKVLKDAIRTSVLSPRWRYVWTSIPCLNFPSEGFSTIDKLYESVTHVLSRHNNQVQLSSFDLYLPHLRAKRVQRIMNRAFSRNVQQVSITSLIGNDKFYYKGKPAPPLSLPGSQTLKHLTLRRYFNPFEETVVTLAQEFSSLTTLHLYYVSLHDGFLSMCPNLKNLTLHRCRVTGSSVFRICHPRLSNLTLEDGDFLTRTVNVVTPQLKHLTILKYKGGFQVAAPKLASLHFKGPCPRMFSTDGFHCLEKALLSFHSEWDLSISFASTIISLLQQFHTVKLLSLSMEIIQLLNSAVELISHQPSPLANLESLRLLPKIYFWLEHEHTRNIVSTEVKNYLLSSSPKATLTEVLQEACCVI